MSETQTLTLADFLLARIAEREAEVERSGTFAVGHADRCIYEGGYEGTSSCDCGAVARALAECEAKRRIIDYCDPEWGPVLSFLALPYADHSDYRPEWRP